MSEPTLHPNLAKIAVEYDRILERLGLGQITATVAQAEIAQLEARDDQGIRWSIDPSTGEWVRKTAHGDVEYDPAPPTFGYMTPDAYDYTPNPSTFNPSDQIHMAAVNDQLERPPASLTGATRSFSPQPSSKGLARRLTPAVAAATSLSVKVKAYIVGGAVVLLALGLHSCSGPATPAPTPAPKPTPSHSVPVKPAKSKPAPAAHH